MTITAQVGALIGDFAGSVLRNPGVQTSLLLAVWALVILWAVTALWAFRDAMTRTRNVLVVLGATAGILLATPVAFPLAVMVWRILRPGQTVAEAREQQLTIDALRASAARTTCVGCDSAVDADWRRCPWCRTWLQAPCPRCDRLVELSASMCPWCALDLAPGALVPREAAPALVPGATVRGVASPPALVPVMALSGAMAPVMDRASNEPAHATPAGPRTARPQAGRPFESAPPAPAAEAAIPPAPPRRRRPSRNGPSSSDVRRPAEEPVQSSSALW